MSNPTVLSSPSALVYIDYDLTSVPQRPKGGWTRFICISDTHSSIFQIPAGDVLLHAGDLTSWGYPQQVKNTLDWLSSLEHPMKIIVAGNHDLCLDGNLYETDPQISTEVRQHMHKFRSFVKGQSYRDANLYYLEHEMMEFSSGAGKAWHVYGSPSAPRYAEGAFQYVTAADANAIYQRIPDDTEILVTHTPPNGILDKTRRGKHAGCKELEQRLNSLKSCRLHVFGHIHEGAGAAILPGGRVAGRPIIVDLKDVPID
ncbi:Metallo-dependent phosphatase-like protein [Amanita rubescens]|nr:Metallo-dependent phosphatase-like protein [Amanita rubescens]